MRNTASFLFIPARKGLGNRIVCQSMSWRNIVPLNARIVTPEEGFRDGRCPGAEVNEVSRFPPLQVKVVQSTCAVRLNEPLKDMKRGVDGS